MIIVSGSATDYAIMKQVQQLKRMDPNLTVKSLNDQTDFSKLRLDEAVYLVGHGAGGLLFAVNKDALASWLTDSTRGIPKNFGGEIVLLSCYSGQTPYNDVSLATYLAGKLSGHAAKGTKVWGANGYSYGTREFRSTQRSSVLEDSLSSFYTAGSPLSMTDAWLKRKPTHTGGVLQTMGITVEVTKSIKDHLAAVAASLQKTPEVIANEYVASFTKDAKAIEQTLRDIINNTAIKGTTVAEKAEFLVTNPTDTNVLAWNKAIDDQYDLFYGLYLWIPQAQAFTLATVQ